MIEYVITSIDPCDFARSGQRYRPVGLKRGVIVGRQRTFSIYPSLESALETLSTWLKENPQFRDIGYRVIPMDDVLLLHKEPEPPADKPLPPIGGRYNLIDN